MRAVWLSLVGGWQRWLAAWQQPREGWVLLLLFLLVNNTARAVARAGWTADLAILPTTAIFALILAILLAKEPLPAWRAWLWLTGYGIVFTLGRAAEILPTAVFRLGWAGYRETALLNWVAYTTRLTGWWGAVQRGEATEETAVFTLTLLILIWLLAAYAGWATMRQKQPLVAIVFLAATVGINAFFSLVTLWSLLSFAALALLLLATTRLANLEAGWQRMEVQFSADVRRGLVQTIGVSAAVLLLLAYSFWRVERTAVALAFAESDVALTIEGWLDSALAGVERRRGGDEFGNGLGSGVANASGVSTLPRSYLLGDAPELYETVMMTADMTQLTGSEPRPIQHWRAVSYDLYTGQGWSQSELMEQATGANQPLTLQTVSATAIISQTIRWEFDQRVTRYALGMPRSFDHDVVALQRQGNDLAFVQSDSLDYQVLSQVSTATAVQLNQITSDDIDPDLLAHYTTLPDNIPPRVADLARSLVTAEMTPYEQAQAIEAFVQQYPYSLQVNPPPSDSDVVDFFLFQQQAGYCDYYASAMVVLARQLGLPARLAAGFVVKQPDASGTHSIYQIDGHSWAEIYFGEYGWIEFEPTAGFAAERSGGNEAGGETAVSVPDEPQLPLPPSLPPPQDQANNRWLLALALLLVAIVVLWLWQQRIKRLTLLKQYAQMQNSARWLRLPLPSSYTPLEFHQLWQSYLAGLHINRWLHKSAYLMAQLRTAESVSNQLFTTYNQYCYRQQTEKLAPGIQKWDKLYWFIWLIRFFPK
ncbi:MAG: transglutaminase-like domain-containing protein [Chloroflexota bacterium]